MHKKRIVLLYIVIWIVIVTPLSILGGDAIRKNNNYCEYEDCGLKVEDEYEDYCEPHYEVVQEEREWEREQRSLEEWEYRKNNPTPSPSPSPTKRPYNKRNYYGSYGNVYPNDPSYYSDYEDYYYDNEEDFDGIDDAEDYYNDYGGDY